MELFGVGEAVALAGHPILLQDEFADVVAIRGRIVRAKERQALALRLQARAQALAVLPGRPLRLVLQVQIDFALDP